MGAAVGRWNGVAIGGREAVIAAEPGDGPFDIAVAAFLFHLAREDFIDDAGFAFEAFLEEILQAAGEMQHGFFRRFLVLDVGGIALPADFHAAEEIGFGARHAVKPCRGKFGVALAENLRVGLEAHGGAAAAVDFAEGLDFSGGKAPRIFLFVKLLAAGHFHDAMFRQRVHHGHAHAMEAAGGFIDLRVEFAAGVQRGHDHFKGGLVLELGVRIDGNAAAIVGDGEIALGIIFHINPGGMARHGLVHGVVHDFGKEMVEGLFIGAADIHAGAAAHGLQPLQHLNVGGGVLLLAP